MTQKTGLLAYKNLKNLRNTNPFNSALSATNDLGHETFIALQARPLIRIHREGQEATLTSILFDVLRGVDARAKARVALSILGFADSHLDSVEVRRDARNILIDSMPPGEIRTYLVGKTKEKKSVDGV